MLFKNNSEETAAAERDTTAAAETTASEGFEDPFLQPIQHIEPMQDGTEYISRRERRARELEAALDPKNKMGILDTRTIVLSWIVMSIPVIGILIAILWACGLCKKSQKAYLGRAFLILTLIGIALLLITVAVYRFILGYTINDLASVLISIYQWACRLVAKAVTSA